MSDGATVTLIGGDELAVRLAAFPERLEQRLGAVMARLMIGVQRRVKADKLSGQVLRNRTGHLRASIASDVVTAAGTVTGRVGIFGGPTVAYGRAHEYGWSGVQDVAAHTRRRTRAVRARLSRLARRATREGNADDAAFLGYAAGLETRVRAHTRTVTLPARSFLRSALRDERDRIVTTLRGAVGEVVRAA